MPTLLMLGYHFPPSADSGAQRLLGFARHLPRFGWSTVVVAPTGLPGEPEAPALAARVPVETAVYRVRYPRRVPRLLRWLAPNTVWLPYARRAARRAVRRNHPDAVLTSGPPHWVHLLGRYLQKHFDLPWVADFREPWITAALSPEGPTWQRKWALYFERRVMHNANLVLHGAPRLCAAVQAGYPHDAPRMTWLTGGFEPDEFPCLAPAARPAGPLRLVHAGPLDAARDPRPLLDAVAGLAGDSVPPFQLEFLLRPDHDRAADLSAEVRRRGLEGRALCRGQSSYQETLNELCRADGLLLLGAPGRKLGVSAELYDYLGAGRPILALAEEGDVSAVLRDSGVPHRLAPPGDGPRIRLALGEMVASLAGGQMPGVVEEARLRFSRQALAGKLAEMLNAVKGQHEAGRQK